MSTRRILRERKRGLEYFFKQDPTKTKLKYAIEEIAFILEKLKEYDIKRSKTE